MVSRRALQWTVSLLGLAVLASYALGIARAADPEALWGGIGPEERVWVVPFMFVAAAGFLAYAWFVLFKFDDETLAAMRWPWAESDGHGASRVLWSYLLYLVPSALWLESTLLHLEHPQAWSPALVIGVLALVGVGIVMLGLLAWSLYRDGVKGAGWMLAGTVGMGIQSIVNDLIIWVLAFPW